MTTGGCRSVGYRVAGIEGAGREVRFTGPLLNESHGDAVWRRAPCRRSVEWKRQVDERAITVLQGQTQFARPYPRVEPTVPARPLSSSIEVTIGSHGNNLSGIRTL